MGISPRGRPWLFAWILVHNTTVGWVALHSYVIHPGNLRLMEIITTEEGDMSMVL